jgi:hypothetical protein
MDIRSWYVLRTTFIAQVTGYRTQDEQNAVIAELQLHANAAGLRGTVVPIWESDGRYNCIAPRPWHSFFNGLSPQWVGLNINRYIEWQ